MITLLRYEAKLVFANSCKGWPALEGASPLHGAASTEEVGVGHFSLLCSLFTPLGFDALKFFSRVYVLRQLIFGEYIVKNFVTS